MIECKHCIIVVLHILGLVLLLSVHMPVLIRSRKGPGTIPYRTLIISIAALLSSSILLWVDSLLFWQKIFYYIRLAFMILLFFSYLWMIINSGKSHRSQIKIKLMIALSFTLSMAVFVLYQLKSSLFVFDPFPLAAVFSSFLLAISVFKLNLLDIMPLVRRDIMNEMDSLMTIVRFDGMVIDCNDAFARICEKDRRDIIGRNIRELIMPVMSQENELSNLSAYTELIETESDIIKELELNTCSGRRYFEVFAKPYYTNSNKLRGRLIRMTELSRERQLRQLLSDQNKQLAAANNSLSKRTRIAADLKRMTVRNQLARELHDQLGHTIIMAMSSIDRIEQIPDSNERWRKLDELRVNISELLQRSLPDGSTINETVITPNKIYGISAILSELKQDSFQAGIEVEYEIQGSDNDIPASHFHDLNQIFRETMTNAVKHGKAGKIDYFLMISENAYDIVIADDGESEEEYEKGFGLKGIEKRVADLGGTVRFQNESSGFAVFIRVPIKDENSG